jgi:hypothetical protein
MVMSICWAICSDAGECPHHVTRDCTPGPVNGTRIPIMKPETRELTHFTVIFAKDDGETRAGHESPELFAERRGQLMESARKARQSYEIPVLP